MNPNAGKVVLNLAIQMTPGIRKNIAMKSNRIFLTSLLLSPILALTSCESTTGTGALVGAGAGAALGAALGGGRAENIAAGAILGAGTGALAGHLIGRADDRGYYQGRQLPYARSVGRGVVESPYGRHNLINVAGIPHGAVVEDPTTGRYFIRP